MADKVVFAEVKRNIEADPSLVDKFNAVLQFNIKSGEGTKSWTVDLKSKPGGVEQGAAESPALTVSLAEADFVDLVAGNANGQELFMQGKIKFKGNMALAMRMNALFQKKTAGASAAGATAGAADVEDDLTLAFREIEKGIKEDPTLIKKVNGIYKFKVDDVVYLVDLKNAPGGVRKEDGAADCTITLKKDVFMKILGGQMQGQEAFMKGLLKFQGNMALAMKLGMVMGAKMPSKM